MKRDVLEKQGGFLGEHFIFVNHVPVIYFDEYKDEYKIQEFMNNISKVEGGSIIPFVKRKKYKTHQEYRMVVNVQWHSTTEDILDLLTRLKTKIIRSVLSLPCNN